MSNCIHRQGAPDQGAGVSFHPTRFALQSENYNTTTKFNKLQAKISFAIHVTSQFMFEGDWRQNEKIIDSANQTGRPPWQ